MNQINILSVDISPAVELSKSTSAKATGSGFDEGTATKPESFSALVDKHLNKEKNGSPSNLAHSEKGQGLSATAEGESETSVASVLKQYQQGNEPQSVGDAEQAKRLNDLDPGKLAKVDSQSIAASQDDPQTFMALLNAANRLLTSEKQTNASTQQQDPAASGKGDESEANIFDTSTAVKGADQQGAITAQQSASEVPGEQLFTGKEQDAMALDSDESGTKEPSTKESSTEEPSTDKPSAEKPSTEKPSTEQLGVEKQGTTAKGVAQPGSDEQQNPVDKTAGKLAEQSNISQAETNNGQRDKSPDLESAAAASDKASDKISAKSEQSSELGDSSGKQSTDIADDGLQNSADKKVGEGVDKGKGDNLVTQASTTVNAAIGSESESQTKAGLSQQISAGDKQTEEPIIEQSIKQTSVDTSSANTERVNPTTSNQVTDASTNAKLTSDVNQAVTLNKGQSSAPVNVATQAAQQGIEQQKAGEIAAANAESAPVETEQKGKTNASQQAGASLSSDAGQTSSQNSNQSQSQNQNQQQGQSQMIQEAATHAAQKQDSEQMLDAISASLAKETNASVKSSVTNFNDTVALYSKDAAIALKEKVMVMVNQKLQQVEIRLDPAELGSMHVKVNLQNEQASVSFMVQNQQAKEALDQNMGKLKDMLGQSGVDVGNTDVERQDQGGQNNQHGNDFNQGNIANRAGEHDENETISQEINIEANAVAASTSAIDYYA
jgi:flagellar hook-length control protein FliK